MLKKIYLEYINNETTKNSIFSKKTTIKFWGVFIGIGHIEIDYIGTDDDVESCKLREDYYIDLFLNKMKELKSQ